MDLLNEGIDIPEIDTLLLLRPTESSTIFLQQLGRGLRLSEGKAGLTVLDFIGQQRREFRFEERFAALTGLSGKRIAEAVESGFPYLPAGCDIRLDPVAAQTVLANLRSSLASRHALLVSELASLGDVSLATYLAACRRPLSDVYRGGDASWTDLRRRAGLPTSAPGSDEVRLLRAVARMQHIDDDERVTTYRRWLARKAPPTEDSLGERGVRLGVMLHFDMWGRLGGPKTLDEGFDRLWAHPNVVAEAHEMLGVVADAAQALQLPAADDQVVPLAVHARYTRDEALSALGDASPGRPPTSREGVRWIPAGPTDILFVTLRKSQKRFTPTTMYRDYAISAREFHWESQSTTASTSETGRRYIEHEQLGSRVMLFARESDEQRAFLYLGTARYMRHTGDRPMAINWALDWEIPPEFLLEARAVS